MALAYQFYIKGAEQDDAKCMNNLGSMYERGTGVAKDLAEAQKWYERAAELGNEDALANVERVREKTQHEEEIGSFPVPEMPRNGGRTQIFGAGFCRRQKIMCAKRTRFFKAALPVSREVNDFEIRAFLHN